MIMHRLHANQQGLAAANWYQGYLEATEAKDIGRCIAAPMGTSRQSKSTATHLDLHRHGQPLTKVSIEPSANYQGI